MAAVGSGGNGSGGGQSPLPIQTVSPPSTPRDRSHRRSRSSRALIAQDPNAISIQFDPRRVSAMANGAVQFMRSMADAFSAPHPRSHHRSQSNRRLTRRRVEAVNTVSSGSEASVLSVDSNDSQQSQQSATRAQSAHTSSTANANPEPSFNIFRVIHHLNDFRPIFSEKQFNHSALYLNKAVHLVITYLAISTLSLVGMLFHTIHLIHSLLCNRFRISSDVKNDLAYLITCVAMYFFPLIPVVISSFGYAEKIKAVIERLASD